MDEWLVLFLLNFLIYRVCLWMYIVVNVLVLWSKFLPWSWLSDLEDCPNINSFDEISAVKLSFKKIFYFSEEFFVFFFIPVCSMVSTPNISKYLYYSFSPSILMFFYTFHYKHVTFFNGKFHFLLVILGPEVKKSHFYHWGFSDYCLHLYCYFHNVLADMFSGLLQVFVKLWNLQGTSNYILYWRFLSSTNTWRRSGDISTETLWK